MLIFHTIHFGPSLADLFNHILIINGLLASLTHYHQSVHIKCFHVLFLSLNVLSLLIEMVCGISLTINIQRLFKKSEFQGLHFFFRLSVDFQASLLNFFEVVPL